jgi:PKHD-type hydroxylase
MGWMFANDTVENFAFAKNVFTKEECELIISIAQKEKKLTGKIGGHLRNIINKNIRNSKITWIEANKDTKFIFDKITNAALELNINFFNFELYGFNENLQFTEYNAPDGHYEKHIDKDYNRVVRKLSVTVQLSDPSNYEGGELEFHLGSNPKVAEKEQGSLIAFPSYVLHQVKPVTKGTRYSLVGWITGPNFK